VLLRWRRRRRRGGSVGGTARKGDSETTSSGVEGRGQEKRALGVGRGEGGEVHGFSLLNDVVRRRGESGVQW